MSGDLQATCTFFAADRKVASGDVRTVAAAVKLAADAGTPNLLVFDGSGRPMEFDLRGGLDDVLARLPAPALGEPQRRGPGRPKLGVVAREVTLLPRHWEWLAAQPGGASVALRKLVEEARKAPDQKARARSAGRRLPVHDRRRRRSARVRRSHPGALCGGREPLCGLGGRVAGRFARPRTVAG